ncbi:hypothetical protein JW752_01000 [Candidatus Peregrinibacteria bacterium]|nr:hypothetical protein [Candidatus Peregrinibacteria bacterium]
MFEKLKNHLKKHARVYSLGFLALVAVCVSYLYVQVDELENDQLTGWVGGTKPISSTSRAIVPKGDLGTVQPLKPGSDVLLQKGVLTLATADTPPSAIAVAGNDLFVSRYILKAKNEPITITRLTIVNNSKGEFKAPEPTAAVAMVRLEFEGNYPVLIPPMPMAGGQAVFGLNPGLTIPRNGDIALKIVAEVPAMAMVGEELSGKTFRLGIKETTDPAFFKALGESTHKVINPLFSETKKINPFVVRKTKPTFERVMSLNSVLMNGAENDLYAFTVQADPAGSLGLGRLVFDITASGFEGMDNDIRNFKLYKGSSVIANSRYNIVCAMSATNLQTYGMNLCDNDDSVGVKNGNYQIIVTFNQEESLAAGAPAQKYTLKAYPFGYGSITTKLASDDDNMPLSGLEFTNPNMGKIFALGNASSAIFWEKDFDFRDMLSKARNIIWSDKSANLHTYPIVQSGQVTNGSGSYDWTNGYLLGLGILGAHTID